MEKKSYKMHEDEQMFRSCIGRSVEKESEDWVVQMRKSAKKW
jgi:hypothetical protein